MDRYGNDASDLTLAPHHDLGVTLCIVAMGDDWWSWHASHQGNSWSPDMRWYASRAEAEEAAGTWAETMAEQHFGFLCRQPQLQLAA